MSFTNSSVVRRDGPATIDTLLAYLRKLAGDQYYGNVQVSFQAGNVTVVRAEQTIRPADLPLWETPRTRHEQQ
jgi:hypothetical protein